MLHALFGIAVLAEAAGAEASTEVMGTAEFMSPEQAKGGEVESYRMYVSSLTGVGVEVTDSATAWTVIQGWLLSEQGGQRWAECHALRRDPRAGHLLFPRESLWAGQRCVGTLQCGGSADQRRG